MNQEQWKRQYKTLCEEGKINSLFQQPWWLDATGEWNVSLAFRNNQLVGAMPFAIGRKWGIHYIGMPSFTHHLQIWMDKPPGISPQKWLTREKQIIWSLIENLPRFGFFSMVFTENSFDNWLPFHWKGFRQEVRYTFTISQMDTASLDQQMNRNLKRNIRAGNDIHIAQLDDSHEFYKQCQATYKRQQMKMPYTFEAFRKIDGAVTLHDAGIKLGAYTSDKKLLAVSYLLWDSQRAYYLLAGDNDAGRSEGASILLCREALRIAFEEKKVTEFDFCGSMLEPITEMRRQFGAKSVPLMKIFKARYRWLDILYQLTH